MTRVQEVVDPDVGMLLALAVLVEPVADERGLADVVVAEDAKPLAGVVDGAEHLEVLVGGVGGHEDLVERHLRVLLELGHDADQVRRDAVALLAFLEHEVLHVAETEVEFREAVERLRDLRVRPVFHEGRGRAHHPEHVDDALRADVRDPDFVQAVPVEFHVLDRRLELVEEIEDQLRGREVCVDLDDLHAVFERLEERLLQESERLFGQAPFRELLDPDFDLVFGPEDVAVDENHVRAVDAAGREVEDVVRADEDLLAADEVLQRAALRGDELLDHQDFLVVDLAVDDDQFDAVAGMVGSCHGGAAQGDAPLDFGLLQRAFIHERLLERAPDFAFDALVEARVEHAPDELLRLVVEEQLRRDDAEVEELDLVADILDLLIVLLGDCEHRFFEGQGAADEQDDLLRGQTVDDGAGLVGQVLVVGHLELLAEDLVDVVDLLLHRLGLLDFLLRADFVGHNEADDIPREEADVGVVGGLEVAADGLVDGGPLVVRAAANGVLV